MGPKPRRMFDALVQQLDRVRGPCVAGSGAAHVSSRMAGAARGSSSVHRPRSPTTPGLPRRRSSQTGCALARSRRLFTRDLRAACVEHPNSRTTRGTKGRHEIGLPVAQGPRTPAGLPAPRFVSGSATAHLRCAPSRPRSRCRGIGGRAIPRCRSCGQTMRFLHRTPPPPRTNHSAMPPHSADPIRTIVAPSRIAST